MKEGIHPGYMDCVISCACGNQIQTKATVPTIHVEICSNCHPYFTGKQKIVDTAGRVEKFQKRYKDQPAPVVKPKAKPRPRVQTRTLKTPRLSAKAKPALMVSSKGERGKKSEGGAPASKGKSAAPAAGAKGKGKAPAAEKSK